MTCACHGEPAYWQADRRLRAGGWWECPVKRRQVSRAGYHARYRAKKLQQQRDRYDSDPIYRIEKRLNDDARKRRQRLDARRAIHVSDDGGQ